MAGFAHAGRTMMTPDEVAEFVECLITARCNGDRVVQIGLLHDLLRFRPEVDVVNVALVLAGTFGDGAETPPDGFHKVVITRTGPDGVERPGSVLDLPPHVATFVQMTVALNNDDKPFARDLCLGYCGGDGRRALALLVYGLNEVVHKLGGCRCQRRPRHDGSTA